MFLKDERKTLNMNEKQGIVDAAVVLCNAYNAS